MPEAVHAGSCALTMLVVHGTRTKLGAVAARYGTLGICPQ